MIRARALRAPAWTPLRLAVLAAALAALYCGTVRAETIALDDHVAVRESDVARPDRGMTMKMVEARFGAPQQRHPAVGKPAITRWDYPQFTVFFENQYVIHAVVNPAS